VVGARPVAVAAPAAPPAGGGAPWARGPEHWLGRMSADGTVQAGADARPGAALFAGAELVGVLADGRRAVAAASLAAEDEFRDLAGRLDLVRVQTPAAGFPMLR
jgi:hypothetical protein